LFKLQAKALVVDAELNAICDFILEAGEWAAELAAVPLEQRQISRSFFRFLRHLKVPSGQIGSA
jgi:hypothetical protein